jgi:hypothetical protein
MMNHYLKDTRIFFLFILFFILSGLTSGHKEIKPSWPGITNESKPWVRWWWMGNAVDSAGLKVNIGDLKDAGFGGMELTSIYGVKGYEDKFIQFESPEWMKMLGFTLGEAARQGMGLDVASAPSWPFGGSWVDDEIACKYLAIKKIKLSTGQKIVEPIEFTEQPYIKTFGGKIDISEVKNPISSNTNLKNLALDQVRFARKLPLVVLMAYGTNGQKFYLNDKVNMYGFLDWQAPMGDWTIYAAFQGWHGKQVERASPGGEGNVVDHFSAEATKKYLAHFDEAAKNIDVSGIRAFFNDSYEVDDSYGMSDWTPDFFEKFIKRRGYDLRNFLPALFYDDSTEINNRVHCDFQETLSDLLLEDFTRTWAAWAKQHHAQIRNQAHGSPANILDLYAASGIPETEGTDPVGIKFASSAGHVSGKKLVSAEAATWLDEHFKANLSSLKQNLDLYLANGVNHVVYHGSPYSPASDPWPGWMFYASEHFAPTNTLWSDLPAINKYVARCQSFLQDSKPANDILVYFPMYDLWSEKGNKFIYHFTQNPAGTPVEKIGNELLTKGYTFDFISDRQISLLGNEGGNLASSGNNYKTIVVPACRYIPLETMQKLASLEKGGATVIFLDSLPGDVPGMNNLKARQETFRNLVQSLKSENPQTGKGKLLVGKNLEDLLSSVGVRNEASAEKGLWVNRVNREDGICYFISNWTGKKVDDWLVFNASGAAAVIFDPLSGDFGEARMKKSGQGQTSVYLQMRHGETRILQFYKNPVDAPDFPVWEEAGDQQTITGGWEISFIKGGPTLPSTFKTTELKSWSQIPGLEEFSGTAAYSISFRKPKVKAKAWHLELGKINESARVLVNGRELGVLPGPEYSVVIPGSVLKKTNRLEIRVSNLMANRIIGMEKRGERYQRFYNVNYAAKFRENVGKDGVFTTLGWKPLDSGLIGPVVLQPLKIKP